MNQLTDVDWSQIPKPDDDGSTDHLLGMDVPAITLMGTDGKYRALAELTGTTIIYAYPMIGRPDASLPIGWDSIPGARGCTPQSCAFRDHAQELTRLGVDQLFGVSTQNTDYQREAVQRLHLPFTLLSDEELALTKAMNLPTMNVDGRTLLKRFTLMLEDTTIIKVFYPVFPPSENAARVVSWLRSR